MGDLICTHSIREFTSIKFCKQVLCVSLLLVIKYDFAVGPPLVFPLLYPSYEKQHKDELLTLLNVIDTSRMKVPILLGTSSMAQLEQVNFAK